MGWLVGKRFLNSALYVLLLGLVMHNISFFVALNMLLSDWCYQVHNGDNYEKRTQIACKYHF